MAKYEYPAIFTKEKKGYSVAFADIDGCFITPAGKDRKEKGAGRNVRQ